MRRPPHLLGLLMRVRDGTLRLRSFVWALGLALLVGLLGFGLLAVAYGRPLPAALRASAALNELLHYRLVSSEIRIAGQPLVDGLCFDGRFRGRSGRIEHGDFLQLSNGRDYLVTGSSVRRLGGQRQPSRIFRAELALAGCAGPLARRLADRLLHQPRFPLGRGSLYRLDLGGVSLRAPDIRVLLQFRGVTARPVGLLYDAGGVHGASRLRLMRLTSGRERRLRSEFRERGRGILRRA